VGSWQGLEGGSRSPTSAGPLLLESYRYPLDSPVPKESPPDLLSVTHPRPDSFARRIFSLLGTEGRPDSSDARCFPTILVQRPHIFYGWSEAGSFTAADSAVAWFCGKGLLADRTRMDLGGYPERLQELLAPPPWIDVQMEDILQAVPPDREKELRPLAIQSDEFGWQSMIAKFQSYRECLSRWKNPLGVAPSDTDHIVASTLESDFRELLMLGASIGPGPLYEVYDAVFGLFDDPMPVPGAPDLLVWHPDGLQGGWFFSEVKAPGDSLRDSQKSWLCEHWDLVKGHFVLTLLE